MNNEKHRKKLIILILFFTVVLSAIVLGLGLTSINAAQTKSLVFLQQPTNALSEVNISPAIRIAGIDANGNINLMDNTTIITITLGNSRSAILSGTTTQTVVNGVATFNNLSIAQEDTAYFLIVTPSSSSSLLQSINSTAFDIGYGTATKIIIRTQPVGSTGGLLLATQPIVIIEDDFGNIVLNYSLAVTVSILNNPPGNGNLTGTTSIVPTQGVATFTNLSIDKIGTGYTLQFTSSGLSSVISSPFNITVGPASQLVFTTSPSLSQTVSTTLSPAPVVQIQDAGNNLITSDTGLVTISIGTNVNTASLLGSPLTMNAVGGIADFTASALSLDSSGFNYTLQASRVGLSTGTSSTFNETGNSFTSTWTTTGINTTIVLPLVSGAGNVFDFIVDWGDGSGTAHITTNSASHLFASIGTYTITCSHGVSPASPGVLTGWSFGSVGTSRTLIKNITRWGTMKLGNTTSQFNACTGLTTMTPSDVLILSGTTSFSLTFVSCSNLTSVTNLNSWNTSPITDMTAMFQGDSVFDQDLITSSSSWDVSHVTTFFSMFNSATAFGTTNGHLTGWNTSSATNMSQMFAGLPHFNGDVTFFNTSAVTTMSQMFQGASVFDQDLITSGSTWDVSHVTTFFSMFNSATAFGTTNGHVTGWNTSSATNMSQMFANTPHFNRDVTFFNTSNVTNMSLMFQSAIVFDQDLITSGNIWNVSNVTSFSAMFNAATAFGTTNGHLTSWNTSSATNMSTMFTNTAHFNRDVTFFNTSNVTNMSLMFQSAIIFDQDLLTSGSTWDISHVTNFTQMFNGATAFGTTNGHLTGWNTVAATTMTNMFSNTPHFNRDLSFFNTANVISMGSMFQSATVFDQDLITSGSIWNVSKVTDFSIMFDGATAFGTTNGHLTGWNTAAATNMSFMFTNTTHFNRDISFFNTAAVTNMNQMFNGAGIFNQNISTWDTHNVTNMANMLSSASAFDQNLPNVGGTGLGTQWDVSKVTTMNGMFQSATAFGTANGNIDNWNTILVADMRNMFNGATHFNRNLAAWNVTGLTSALGAGTMFTGATAYNTPSPNPNYSNLLIGWAAQAVKTSVTFGAGTAKFSTALAGASKTILTGTDLWVITDGGGV